MSKAATKVRRDTADADHRLAELKLTRAGLLSAVMVATHEARNVTPFHCLNAAGTFAYQYGTWALRNEFVGEEWQVDRANGVEAIWNEDLQIRVVFSNVDIACNDEQLPRPRSPKGAGSERACSGNLFEDLPRFVSPQEAGTSTYYLMVDEAGSCELSRPVIKSSTFSAFVERIYLSSNEGESLEAAQRDVGERTDVFDPQVVRK